MGQNRLMPQDTTCAGFKNLPDHLVGAAEQRDRKVSATVRSAPPPRAIRGAG
jgi:hypothetical protein